MKIDVAAIIAAIQQAVLQTACSVWEQALKLANSFVALPFQIFAGGAGITGAQRLPSQRAEFQPPVDTKELVAELQNGPKANAVVRDLARDAVTQVYHLANLAKISQQKRAEADLSAVHRKDVQALLIKMTPAELEALTRMGSGAVRKLLLSGDSGVWGVPSVKPDDVMTPPESELAMKLRAVKMAMAKAGGPEPYTMPKL